MVQKGYSQVFKILIALDAALDVRSRKPIELASQYMEEKGASLFKIAYKKANHDILTIILMNKDKRGVRKILYNAMLRNEIIWNEINSGEKGTCLNSSLIMLDTEMIIPWDF